MFKSELTSFSNSQYLFGYVHYIKAVYEYMPPYMILKTGRDLTSLNIEKKQLSVTGLYYKSIIKGLCDTMFMEEPENRNSNLIVFPNPANDEIHIQINPAEENNYCLRICNIYGQVIKSLLKNKLSKGVHNYTFDTGNIAGGIYLIQLQTANLSVSKKVIINK
jgi:hypothetical protein